MSAETSQPVESLAIELRDIDKVIPYENNPRINDQAVDAVVQSIKDYGWRQPIVVDADGVVIVGHVRLKAARKLGLARVPVHVAADLPPEKVKAYRIGDNKTGELAEWDLPALRIELSELQAASVDLTTLGFGDEELAALMSGDPNGVQAGLTDPDDIPLPPDEATTQPGDIWILGNHRLMCGDSCSPADLDRLRDGQVIDLVNMDPPYNVKVEPRSNNAIAAGLSSFEASNAGQKRESKCGKNHHQQLDAARDPGKLKRTDKKLRAKDRPLANDFVTPESFDRMLTAWFNNASRVLKPGGSFYIWGGYANLANYPAPIKAAGFYFSQAIVWDKQHPVLTRKDFMGAFEICFYGWKEGAGHHFHGPNNATDLWHVKKVNPQSMVHLTEKPAELAVRAIQYSSKPGDAVLDLFGGSGSTLIGCEQTGRRAYLMEIDPLYCDVIVQRWEQFTGEKAERIRARSEEEPCQTSSSVSP
jgi:DNA modification methylase